MFYTLEKISSSLYADSDPYRVFKILIQLSPKEIVVQRTIYSILMILSDVGGFAEAIIFLGGFLVANYTFRLYIGNFI
jgi:hypothetical protein